jgi:hypothetical protein
MSLENFDQRSKDFSIHSRPEDELETPENLSVTNRERAFIAEGGFRDLLKLKIFIEEDLLTKGIALSPMSHPYFMEDVINDPRKYAVSALGFDILQKQITDDELKTALSAFLEKCKISISQAIDKYIPPIIAYESVTKSKALDRLKNMLEDCKKHALNGEWRLYAQKLASTQSYLEGIEDLVNLCCGSAPEDENVRKVLKI